MFEVKEIIVKFLRIFFLIICDGQKCIICNKKTLYLPICNDCINFHYSVKDFLEKKKCRICGSFLLSTKCTCSECRKNIVLKHTDAVYSLFAYRLWNKDLLFMWKMNGNRILTEFFAAKMAKVLHDYDFKVLVPVPPRKGKIAEKGWDQINDLCKFLKFRYGFSILDILERKSEVQQKKLSREERLETIVSAYTLKNQKRIAKNLKQFSEILPLKVCIIDDVKTTGSTLECCAKLLKDYGIKEVFALTLFTVS